MDAKKLFYGLCVAILFKVSEKQISKIYDIKLLISVGILLILLAVDRILRRKKNLPPGPIGFPILGYTPFLTKLPHLKFIKLGEKYGSIFSMYLGSRLVVVLNDGEEIRETLSKKELLVRPPNSPFQLFGIKTPFFSPDFKLWHEQRSFVVQSMKGLSLGRSEIEEHIQDEIQCLLKVLEQTNGKPMNLEKPLTPSMSNNICSSVFGERYEYNNPERIIMDNSLNEITGRLGQTNAVIYFPWMRHFSFILKLFEYEKAVAAADSVFNLFEKKINQHKETLDPKNTRDFIDSYLLEMDARKVSDPETTFTEENLKGIAINLFGAGSETVRTCISWCMYIMAARPEIQKKVHGEIYDVIGSSRLPQFLDQKNMPYTQAIIREVLRWKTIVPLNILRYTLDDVEVSGYHIPKGIIVIANLWAVHHDPKYWTNPEEFQPNRFLSSDGTLLKTNYLMPFSVGKRSCPGEPMAVMEVFLYFVSILQKFKVSFPEGFTPTFEGELGITFRLKHFEICFSPNRVKSSLETLKDPI